MITMDFDLTGSMKLDGGSVVPITENRIRELLYPVLKKRFQMEPAKLDIRKSSNRLRLACPYCGDSMKKSSAKRGNMRIDLLVFKCYNGGCGQYADLETFLKDFGCEHNLTDDERFTIQSKLKESRNNPNFLRSLQTEACYEDALDDEFLKYLVPREYFMKAMGLWEVFSDSTQGVYLTKRFQIIDKKFAWDNKQKRLFIFNLDPTGHYIFGMQVKPFNQVGGSKYITYNLSGIWSKFLRKFDEDFLEHTSEKDKLSIIFGVLKLDFNQWVTVFEGPMDHFLFKNSVATCSIETVFPFDIDNKRFFQDNDVAGRKKALEWNNEGHPVFMWKKFIDDKNLHGKKIKDLNDAVIYAKINELDFNDIINYFTTSKLDGIYI